MSKELFEYLAILFVGDVGKADIKEAVYFSPSNEKYGNPFIKLVEIFQNLNVLWYEEPGNISYKFIKENKSERNDWYIRPSNYFKTGKTRKTLCIEALEFLEKETTALAEDRMPIGVEQAIKQLALLAKSQDHEEEGLAAINRGLIKDNIQLVKTLSEEYGFEYGILTDPEEPFYIEADMKLKKLEKGYRQLIKKVLSSVYSDQWETKLGLTEERLNKIRIKIETAQKKRNSFSENGLLDYSDFYDLGTITKKCWDHLAPWLKDRNETYELLSILNSFRNDMAHSRIPLRDDLMLIIGIASRLSEKVKKGLMSERIGDSR